MRNFQKYTPPGKKNEANCTLLWEMRKASGVFCLCVIIPYLCDVVLSLFKFQTSPFFCTDKYVKYFGSRNITFVNFIPQTSRVMKLTTLHCCHIIWLIYFSSSSIFSQGVILADAFKPPEGALGSRSSSCAFSEHPPSPMEFTTMVTSSLLKNQYHMIRNCNYGCQSRDHFCYLYIFAIQSVVYIFHPSHLAIWD